MANKAVKLPSGSWRVQVTVGRQEGKLIRKSFTAPTKAEAEYKAAEYKRAHKAPETASMTVRDAVRQYIDLNAPVLAPTTVAGYEKVLRSYFQELLELDVSSLTDKVCQSYINAELSRPSRRGGTVSAKTICNAYGLISSALRASYGLRFSVKLPKSMKKSIILPEPALVMDAVIGSPVELPCLLALWLSFSMSEIRGLRCSDLKRSVLTINRVMVDVDGFPVVKDNAKVDSRLRSHELPPYLLKLVRATPEYERYQKTGEDDYLVRMTSRQIRRGFQKCIQAKGYTMTFHQLRHLNASIMLALGVPEKYAMERGGWKSPHVMQTVYQHTFTDKRKNVDSTINDYFNGLITRTVHTTPDKP